MILELSRAHTPRAACINFVAVMIINSSMTICVQIMYIEQFYDLATLAYIYIELEHAQPNQHMVLLGVVYRRGRYNGRISWICSAHGES